MAFADAIYKNGNIYTVDQNRIWAESVAIQNGRFIAIGPNAETESTCGPNTEVIDLEGRFAMPGLHDMHIHGVEGALAQLFHCNFSFTATGPEILEAVEQFAAERPEEAWIVGGAWLLGAAPDLHRSALDAVCPERPVFLWDAAHHNAWVNSRALALGGISADTPDPAGGEIVRDANGEPTGLLLEEAATQLSALIPQRSTQEYTAAIQWLAKTLNRLGITSIKEAAVNRPMMTAYKALDTAGALNLRVGCHFLHITPFAYDPADLEPLLNDRHQYAGERVKVDFLKLFLDGVPVARTACMLEPYVGDDPATHDPYALMLVEPERLKEVLIKYDKAGLIVKMHATGDASLRAALDAIEAARQANGDSGLGHEIAHPQNVHPDDLPRFAALGAVPDLCPILWHPSPNRETSIVAAIGKARSDTNWPIGSYFRSGARMIGGTDWPAMAPTPSSWPGIEALVTREDPYGRTPGKLGTDEGIDLAAALEIYTINGAKAARHAADCGTIEVGKWADMIVLNHNLFEIDPKQIGRTEVMMTVLEGEIVYAKDQS